MQNFEDICKNCCRNETISGLNFLRLFIQLNKYETSDIHLRQRFVRNPKRQQSLSTEFIIYFSSDFISFLSHIFFYQ
jgi:hypothetical protein